MTIFGDPRSGRRNQPGSNEGPWIVLLIVLTIGLACGLLWGLTGALDPATVQAAGTKNPVGIILAQARGYAPVSGWQISLSLAGLILFIGVGTLLFKAFRNRGKNRSRIDHLASRMSRPKDFTALMEKAAQEDAARLRAEKAGPGVPLAKLVGNGQRLYASWEWVQIWLMGPRAGKTSCVCVPQIIETKGPVLATSNKRDIVDLTRGPRSLNGVVWVHDVQNIIGEEPSWWWNPLSFVDSMEAAETLTDVFISSATDAGAKQDAYFESDGKRLLSHMLFAASIAGQPITDVFTWAQDPEDKTPRNLLIEAGHPGLGAALGRIQTLTEKQRDGVYGTMRPWVNVLSYENVVPWITDDPTKNRPEFNHVKFASSTDTLYLISKEGAGTARAVTAALAVAVLTAAEKTAARQPGGRLSPPMAGVLDEVANVVRWRQLPDVYSHYGSRGIVLSSFFQGWDQGLEAFGEKGMKKLWSAANIRVAGSGLSDNTFLPFLSQLVGDHDVVKRSSSTQKGGRSVSTSIQREKIMDVADLAALPRGRAILTSSGMPPALIELEHFTAKNYGRDCLDSQRLFENSAEGSAS
ncbi:hypothetical protein HD598_002741 [Neomicrococcus aestuarii]|uniref:TraD/TraG TraM recognition site domain-containing protein n=1 Tax=Neomicrococcus aestuarii TaxID=556325 RepID=A0A7W8X2K6_9MICC|nr:TraM recognition domain-containing protein [Neomicrococcus aestuarii]MBB5513994.1 hypothetical protein [Neomicrococcus aestuarii]